MTGGNSFPGFEIRRDERALLVQGSPVALGARAFDLLAYLAENRERVVGKQELMDRVWPDLSVEEGNLTVQVSTLRKLLGKEVITTITGYGYRFTPPDTADDVGTEAQGPMLPDRPSVAVLPFNNHSGDPGQTYFIDGVVGDIINGLSRVRAFFVIAQSSSFAFRGRDARLADIGRQLGVRYLLEGSFQQSGERLRIVTQLVEAETGRMIWSDRFEGTREKVFELQDEITARIVAAIEPGIVRAEIDRTRHLPTESLRAYELCLRAMPAVYSHASLETLEEAIRHTRAAIAADPGYSYAKGMHAWAHLIAFGCRWFDLARARDGLEFVKDVLHDHNGDSTTLAHAGLAMSYLGHDHATGRQAIERALQLNPNSAIAHNAMGMVTCYLGETPLSIESFRTSLRLNPLDPYIAFALGGLATALAQEGRYEDAVAHFDQALAESSDIGSFRHALMACLVALGRLDAARGVAALVRAREPGLTVSSMRAVKPYTDPAFVRFLADGMRAVGFPEV